MIAKINLWTENHLRITASYARLPVLRLPLGGRERRTMAGVNIADGHHLATTKSVYVQDTHILDGQQAHNSLVIRRLTPFLVPTHVCVNI